MKQNFTVRHGALDGVEAFLSVAHHGSFRRGAVDLGVTPSAISQTIRALESRIGAPLFVRTTRSVGLTEAGRQFLVRAKPAFEELVAARDAARELGQTPAGLLRLSVPRAVVPLILEPMLVSFHKAYPKIELEIAASAELADIAADGFDAGIRVGQFIAADMVAVRLTPAFPLVVVGSPEYLRARGQPARIADLRDHSCLRMRRSDGSIAPWRFAEGNETGEVIVSGPLIAHDYPTLLGAAIQGLGLTQVAGPVANVAIADGRLQPVLASFALTMPGLFLYYPDRRQVLPKLRAFIEHARHRSVDATHARPSAGKSRKFRPANRP